MGSDEVEHSFQVATRPVFTGWVLVGRPPELSLDLSATFSVCAHGTVAPDPAPVPGNTRLDTPARSPSPQACQAADVNLSTSSITDYYQTLKFPTPLSALPLSCCFVPATRPRIGLSSRVLTAPDTL